MENILLSIIGIVGAVLTGSVGYLINKRFERREKWIDERIKHYKELLKSISDLADQTRDAEQSNQKFNVEMNTIALVAPQSVINAAMDFRMEISMENKNRTHEGHDIKLKRLVLEIRKDIGRNKNDDPKNFKYNLIGLRRPQDVHVQSKGQ